MTISATISRRRGEPERNLDVARRGGVERTLARAGAVADLPGLVDALLGEVLGEVLRADGDTPARWLRDPDAADRVAVCSVDRDRASSRGRRAPEERWCDVAVVWARLPAGAPWVRVAGFTALPR